MTSRKDLETKLGSLKVQLAVAEDLIVEIRKHPGLGDSFLGDLVTTVYNEVKRAKSETEYAIGLFEKFPLQGEEVAACPPTPEASSSPRPPLSPSRQCHSPTLRNPR